MTDNRNERPIAGLNYIYFGIFLAFLLILNIHHIFLISVDDITPRLFFLLYTVGQTIAEVLALALIAVIIKRYLHKGFYYFFIALSFIFLLTHLIDFILVRVMDMSFWFALGIVFDETFENFIEMLQLTGIDMGLWLLGVPALVIIAIGGVSFYLFTHKYVDRRSFRVNRETLFKCLCVIPVALIALDVTIAHYLTEEHYQRFERALPWKGTLIGKRTEEIAIEGKFPPSPSEKEMVAALLAVEKTEIAKPNIYLFVAESLRSDFINGETAPHLAAFATGSKGARKSFSNANGTNVSWYSIFHANYPFYWSETLRSKWSAGSLPLAALKELGYGIRVYSGAQLKYYHLDELMFGKDLNLLQAFHHFPHYKPKEAWESDTQAHAQLLSDMDNPELQSGNCFIIFFDSTHFHYSWPPTFDAPFSPVGTEEQMIRFTPSYEEIEMIKNRYRNSISFIDTLFDQFIQKLDGKEQGSDAVVVFTGDHGEEFNEEGQLFHASHLSPMQVQVPIYYRLGKASFPKMHGTTSHIDIFPTILHHVVGDERYNSIYRGCSLLSETKRASEIIARYNGGRTPYEFAVTDGYTIATFQFDQRKIFSSKKLLFLGERSLSNDFHEEEEAIAAFKLHPFESY